MDLNEKIIKSIHPRYARIRFMFNNYIWHPLFTMFDGLKEGDYMTVILIFMINVALHGYFGGMCSKCGLTVKDGRYWLLELIVLGISVTGIYIGRSLSF